MRFQAMPMSQRGTRVKADARGRGQRAAIKNSPAIMAGLNLQESIVKSAADPQHVEIAGTAASTAAAPLTGGCICGRRWCGCIRDRSRLWRAFGADQNNPVVLCIE